MQYAGSVFDIFGWASVAAVSHERQCLSTNENYVSTK